MVMADWCRRGLAEISGTTSLICTTAGASVVLDEPRCRDFRHRFKEAMAVRVVGRALRDRDRRDCGERPSV